MQKIKYISPSGVEAQFKNGPPYIFESVLGIGPEETQIITSEAAFANGRNYHGIRVSDREITVNMHIYGATRAEMYRRRQELIALLAAETFAGGKLGRLEYQNDAIAVWIPVIVKKGPQAVARVSNYNKSIQLVFYCPDPYWRSMAKESVRVAYLDGGLTFPLTIDHGTGGVTFGAGGASGIIYNFGDSAAPVEISIMGPADNPQIIKASTSEYIKLNRDLAAGDRLYINTDPHNLDVTITRENGLTEPGFGYLDLSSAFFMLPPGGTKLQYISDNDTKATEIVISAYSRYGGV